MLVNKDKKLTTADSIHSYTIRPQILATGEVDVKDLECGQDHYPQCAEASEGQGKPQGQAKVRQTSFRSCCLRGSTLISIQLIIL